MTKEELDATLNKLLYDIATIKTNWIIWKGLRDNLQEGAEYTRILEYSPCFWTVTLNNLLSNTLLGLARLYDEHKDCVGIKKLINICEQNQTLFPQERKEVYTDPDTGEQTLHKEHVNIRESIKMAKIKYQSINKFRDQLITLSDKHLAHTDKQNFLDVKSLYNEISLKKKLLIL